MNDLQLKALALDGVAIVSAASSPWWLALFDQGAHVLGVALIIATLGFRAAIAWRAWQRSKRWRR